MNALSTKWIPVLAAPLLVLGVGLLAAEVHAPPADVYWSPKDQCSWLLGRWESEAATNVDTETEWLRSGKPPTRWALVLLGFEQGGVHGQHYAGSGSEFQYLYGDGGGWLLRARFPEIRVARDNMIYIGPPGNCWHFRYERVEGGRLRLEMVSAEGPRRFSALFRRVDRVFPLLGNPVRLSPRVEGAEGDWDAAIAGDSLGKEYWRLWGLVDQASVRSLYDFYVPSPSQREANRQPEQTWFSAADGLGTVRVLQAGLEQHRAEFRNHAALREDLSAFASILVRAQSLGKRWSLFVEY